MIVERRGRVVAAPPERVFAEVERLGGDAGWPYANVLWRIRGLVDRLVGGVGMRLGRRDPDHLRVGDALDFWRVEELRRPTLLRLRAEMKVPGRAWLQYEVTADRGRQPSRPDGVLRAQGAAWSRLLVRALPGARPDLPRDGPRPRGAGRSLGRRRPVDDLTARARWPPRTEPGPRSPSKPARRSRCSPSILTRSWANEVIAKIAASRARVRSTCLQGRLAMVPRPSVGRRADHDSSVWSAPSAARTAVTTAISRSVARAAARRALMPAASPRPATRPAPRSGSRRLLTRAQHLSGAPFRRDPALLALQPVPGPARDRQAVGNVVG